jgi:hypothetical protein
MNGFKLFTENTFHPTIIQIAQAVDKGAEAYALADTLEEFGNTPKCFQLASYIRNGGYSHGLSAAAYILDRQFRRNDLVNTIHGEGYYQGKDGDLYLIKSKYDDRVYLYNINDFSHHAKRAKN